jgi:hypothetical protein
MVAIRVGAVSARRAWALVLAVAETIAVTSHTLPSGAVVLEVVPQLLVLAVACVAPHAGGAVVVVQAGHAAVVGLHAGLADAARIAAVHRASARGVALIGSVAIQGVVTHRARVLVVVLAHPD